MTSVKMSIVVPKGLKEKDENSNTFFIVIDKKHTKETMSDLLCAVISV